MMRRSGFYARVLDLAVFLVSDNSADSTGSEFVVDGGLSSFVPPKRRGLARGGPILTPPTDGRPASDVRGGCDSASHHRRVGVPDIAGHADALG